MRGRGGDVSTSQNHRAKDAGAVLVAFRKEEQEALWGSWASRRLGSRQWVPGCRDELQDFRGLRPDVI